ncbi:TonB-dependent receptor [Steroidobacter flavus]|uniref:TonB-dependent receptor n=1 Tax=Steroidobacter flavus TaxID=1842136 RepID=A0ABV8SWB1_9GAMM
MSQSHVSIRGNASRAFAVSSAIAVLLGSTSALAQDAAPQATDQVASGGLEEIVVTAQKREERLVDVPLSVTAVSAETLASQQINDSASLVRAIPSLSYQQGNGPNNSSFRIRGIGTSLFGQGVEPAVSVVVDGVVAARASQGFADLLDVERVEVLRGPQGTLFGKNATAGVVNIVTARPESEFGGNIEVTGAEDNEYRIKGTVTGALSDTVSARFSGYYNDVGGHIDNVATGDDTNGFESWGGRGKLLWDPTDTLSLLLTAEYRKTDADCCSRVPVSITTPALATLISPVVASPDNRSVSNDGLSYSRSDTSTLSLQADWDLGPVTLTSISAYQHYQQDDQFEPDQIASDPVLYVGPSAYSQWNFNAFGIEYSQLSQELRLSSNGSGDLTWVAGLFYANLDMDRFGDRRRARCGSGTLGQPCTVALTYDSSGFNGNFKSDNIAAFGQVDYRLVGGLHLLGGLRTQYEEQKVTGTVYAPITAGDALFPGITPNSGTRERNDSAVTGKAGLRYEFDRNAQVYATYTRGYKSFALDLDASTDFATQTGLDPEHVDAYEVGFKWRAPGGWLAIDTSVFRSNYTDLQVQSIQQDPTTGVFQSRTMNAGSSRTQGVEVEATLRPTDSFSLTASVTYLDAIISVDGQTCPLQYQANAPILTDNFPVNTCYRRQQVVNGVTQTSSPIVDVKDGALPVAPEYRVTLSPRYEHELGGLGLMGFVQLNVNWQDDYQFALEQDPLRVQKSYALVDASVGFSDLNERYKVTLFVRNLFDENYYSQLNHGTILATTASPYDLWANINKDANRYFGVTASYRF